MFAIADATLITLAWYTHTPVYYTTKCVLFVWCIVHADLWINSKACNKIAKLYAKRMMCLHNDVL